MPTKQAGSQGPRSRSYTLDGPRTIMGGGAVDIFRTVYRRGAAPAGQRPQGAGGAQRGPRKADPFGGLATRRARCPPPPPAGEGERGGRRGEAPGHQQPNEKHAVPAGAPAPQRKSPGAERHTDGAPAPPQRGAGGPPTPRGGGGRPNRPPQGRLPARHAEAAGGGDPAGGPDDGRPAGAEEGRPEGARTGADGGPAGAGTRAQSPRGRRDEAAGGRAEEPGGTPAGEADGRPGPTSEPGTGPRYEATGRNCRARSGRTRAHGDHAPARGRRGTGRIPQMRGEPGE